MDFVRSHFGKMNLWPVEHFFEHICHQFWVGATAKQHQTHPKVMTKIVKKCSTLCSSDPRFIRKRSTTYRIHTLIQQLKVLVASSSKTVLWNAWFSRILIFGQPHRLVTKFWNPLAPLLWGKKNPKLYNLIYFFAFTMFACPFCYICLSI